MYQLKQKKKKKGDKITNATFHHELIKHNFAKIISQFDNVNGL